MAYKGLVDLKLDELPPDSTSEIFEAQRPVYAAIHLLNAAMYKMQETLAEALERLPPPSA